jgi:hypothetical protein
MKKALLLLAIMLFAETAFAAAAKKEANAKKYEKRPDPVWGIRLGPQYAGLIWSSTSFGMHAGAAYYLYKFFDVSYKGDVVGLKLFAEPNALFIYKSDLWLEVPMNATFMLTVYSQRFKLSAGPYLGSGITGRYSRKNRFDAGYNAAFGYETAKNAWLILGAAVGLIDAEKNREDTRHFSFKMSLGVDF